jgi:hypothetical protein
VQAVDPATAPVPGEQQARQVATTRCGPAPLDA